MNNTIIGSILLLIIYILSAYGKIFNITGTAKYLQSHIPLPINLCIIAIMMVIILQSVGSGIIIYSAITNKLRSLAFLTICAFILFNIFATLIFHFPPVGDQYLNFLKNLSITGGFVLLLDRFM